MKIIWNEGVEWREDKAGIYMFFVFTFLISVFDEKV